MVSRKKNTVLIADDQQEMRDLLGEKLRALGKDVTAFSSGTRLVQQLEQGEDGVELVVLDLDFGPGEPDGIDILQQVKEVRPELPVIILTGKGSIDAAVEAVQHGAADFIEKDLYVEDKLELGMEKVERMLQVLRENARLKAENEALGRENVFYRTELGQRYRIVSASPKIESLLEQVEQIASIPRPVLIRGERGTGKELIAAALHYGGARANRPFVKLNCAALSDTLLESELFGHERGAFTGAERKKEGRFIQAHGGSLFLDEVSEMPLTMQVKLLRIIQERELTRVGGEKVLTVDVRVVAATNKNLSEQVAKGDFREDLYYRLNVIELEIPPLRKRQEDIPLLAQHFIEHFAQKNRKQIKGFTPAAMDALIRHQWPGNVRELMNAVERGVVLSRSEYLDIDDLPFIRSLAQGQVDPLQLMEQANEGLSLDAVEKATILKALKSADGNKSETARRLGITRKTLHKKLKIYGVMS